MQELVSKGRHRNWRNVAAFVAIGIIVLILVIVGIVLLTGDSANEKHAEAIKSSDTKFGNSIPLEDVVDGKFSVSSFNGTWITGKFTFIF